MLLGRLANVSRSLRRRVLELTAGLAIVGLSPDGHAAGPEAPPSAPQAETSYEATLQALTFRGESAFLVLGEAMRSPTWAARRVGQRLADGIAATSIPSDYFTGLNKGRLVVVYGGFTEKDAAIALVLALRLRGVKAYVKHSGALAVKPAEAQVQLVRLWGRLSDELRHPVTVAVDGAHGEPPLTTSTDERGYYQVWVHVPVKGAHDVRLTANLEERRPARPGCLGFFDKATTVTITEATREVHVKWSPSPDCCDQ